MVALKDCRIVLYFFLFIGQIVLLSIIYKNFTIILYVTLLELGFYSLIKEFSNTRRTRIMIRNRPDINIHDLNIEENEEFSTCVICMTGETEGLVKLDCNHIYHRNCINRWIEENTTCPICRIDLRH